MALKQKCIEESKPKCKFDDFFIDALLALPYKAGLKMMNIIGRESDNLPEENHWSQTIGVAIKGETPYFFEIEYIKEINKPAVFLNLFEISCDDYLDYINLNKYLK
tara:strand:- start:915 stop:1232 length:318 start_codon:yes stop_codon:yes gene_type:complete